MSATYPDGSCGYCGGWNHTVYNCRRVRAIEFYENGSIKKVELHAVAPITQES